VIRRLDKKLAGMLNARSSRFEVVPCWKVIVVVLYMLSYGAHGQSLGIYTKDFLRATGSPETILAPAPTAAVSNYFFQPAGFGTGGEGMGYHYGVALADNVNGKFMRKFAFAAAARREDHYCPIGGASPWRTRLANAFLHTLFAVPQTSKAFNWSSLPASLVSAALSNTYQPTQQQTWTATFERFGTNAAGYMASDFITEITFKPRQPLTLRIVLGPR
jgi:hypothetical protein